MKGLLGDNLEFLRSEKEDRYGDATLGHTYLGKAWSAILNQYLREYGVTIPDIPPHVVLLMMVVHKIQRAVLQTSGMPDDYQDLFNYALLAYEAADVGEDNEEG